MGGGGEEKQKGECNKPDELSDLKMSSFQKQLEKVNRRQLT